KATSSGRGCSARSSSAGGATDCATRPAPAGHDRSSRSPSSTWCSSFAPSPSRAKVPSRAETPIEVFVVMKRLKIVFVFLGSLALSIAIVAFRHRGDAAEQLPVLSTLDGFSLSDQRARTVKLDDLRGQVWIADFIFTGCQSACPMLTTRMRSL